MPLLNTAAKVYAGATAALKVYAGSTLVWSAGTITSLFSGTPTFADQATDSTAYVMGTEFWVNKTAWLTQVRYLHPTVGNLTPRTMALYSTTDGNTGVKVGGDWTMPTPTAGQWCTLTLPFPVRLTANVKYRIATLHPANAGFARTYNYFWSGGSGAGNTQITIGGYLIRPSSAQALNTCQGSYAASATMAFPGQVYQYASYYSDVVITDANPITPYAARKVVAYNAPTAATSIVIPTIATNPGKDLILLGHSAAVMTMPAGWTKTQIALDATELAMWRLPAASHTASMASVTMTQNAARKPALVMIESEISGSIYEQIALKVPVSGNTLWGTDLHTFSKEVGFAFYTSSWGTGAQTGAITSYDQSYTAFADSGDPGSAGASNEVNRMWLAKKEPAAFTSDGVTATLSPALSGYQTAATFTGMLAWDVV